jgi:murein DD-endopeptidase MepM/ murein hydrolase activator NlpD
MDKKGRWQRILHKLRFTYRLTIMNESTFEEKFSLRLSRLNVFVVFTIISLALITLTVFIIAFTPLREYIPGYGSVEEREMVYSLSMKTDSLEQELVARDVYFQNFFGLIMDTDSAMLTGTYSNYSDGGPAKTISGNSDATGLYLLSPLNGSILNKFNTASRHFAVDISAPKGSIVQSISDGMVLFSDWTLAGGFTTSRQGDFGVYAQLDLIQTSGRNCKSRRPHCHYRQHWRKHIGASSAL